MKAVKRSWFLIRLGWLLIGLPSVPSADEIHIAGTEFVGTELTRLMTTWAEGAWVPLKLDLRGSRLAMRQLAVSEADAGLLLLPADEVPPKGMINLLIGYYVAVVVAPRAFGHTQLTYGQLRARLMAPSPESRGPVWIVPPNCSLAWPLVAHELGLDLKIPEPVLLAGDASVLLSHLQSDATALGILSNTGQVALGAEFRLLALAKEEASPAYLPTPEAVSRGDYALRLPLYVSFRRTEVARLHRWLHFMLSSEVGECLTAAGFVGVPVDRRDAVLRELAALR